jgi:hypothetical protein
LLESRAWRFAVVIFWFAIFLAFAFAFASEVARLAASVELVLSEVMSYGSGCRVREGRSKDLESPQTFAFQTRTEPQAWRAKIFKSYSIPRFWNNLNSKSSIMPKHDMESDEQATPTPSSTDSIPRPDLNPPRSSKSSYEAPLLQIKSEASETPGAVVFVGGLPFGLAPQSQQVGAVLGLDSKTLKSSPSSSLAWDVSLPGNSVTPDVAKMIESGRKVKVRDPCRQNLLVWPLLTWNT